MIGEFTKITDIIRFSKKMFKGWKTTLWHSWPTLVLLHEQSMPSNMEKEIMLIFIWFIVSSLAGTSGTKKDAILVT